MTVRLTCPNPDCGAVAEVEGPALGRRTHCRACGQAHAFDGPEAATRPTPPGDETTRRDPASGSPPRLRGQFGRYRLLKTIGRGGMGSVYLALDTKLDRQVALKVPHFAANASPEAILRFEREARAAATLDHPNLCPIHDVGEVDGVPYLTMPYIEGRTLGDLLAGGPAFTETQAAALVLKLARALHEAHARGIIHRDLKPGNVMINRRREPIVMDFGLARAVDGGDQTITRADHVLGTAHYMAPEQAAGAPAAVGPAADVYSLGVILHELLTGRRPFEGPLSVVIGLKCVNDPRPPSTLRPGLDPTLDATCLKAIARDPARRYPTMAALAEALGAYLARSTAPTPTPTPTPADPKAPETAATRVFADIVAREPTLLLDREPAEVADRQATRQPVPAWAIAVGAVAAVLLLGVLRVATTGTDRVGREAPKPKAIARVDAPAVVPPGDPPPAVDATPPTKVDATPPPKVEPSPAVGPAPMVPDPPGPDQPPEPTPTPEPTSTPEPGPRPPATDPAATKPAPDPKKAPTPAAKRKGSGKATVTPPPPPYPFEANMVWKGWFDQNKVAIQPRGGRGHLTHPVKMTILEVEGDKFRARIEIAGREKSAWLIRKGSMARDGRFRWFAADVVVEQIGTFYPMDTLGVQRGDQTTARSEGTSATHYVTHDFDFKR